MNYLIDSPSFVRTAKNILTLNTQAICQNIYDFFIFQPFPLSRNPMRMRHIMPAVKQGPHRQSGGGGNRNDNGYRRAGYWHRILRNAVWLFAPLREALRNPPC